MFIGVKLSCEGDGLNLPVNLLGLLRWVGTASVSGFKVRVIEVAGIARS
jgi:hypothetical protein